MESGRGNFSKWGDIFKMYAYNAGYTRKLKKGRPFRFKPQECSYIEIKKKELFERYEAQKEEMNLASLAYNFGKLTKDEYDIACFLEHVCVKMQKGLGIKRMPSSSPNTWSLHIQNSWNMINVANQDSKAADCWKKVKDFVNVHNPKIATEFLDIIARHYSYEELQAVKMNFSVTDVLKEGLQTVKRMFEIGYI